MRDGVPGESERLRGQPFETAAFGTKSFIIEDDCQGATFPYPMRDGVPGECKRTRGQPIEAAAFERQDLSSRTTAKVQYSRTTARV